MSGFRTAGNTYAIQSFSNGTTGACQNTANAVHGQPLPPTYGPDVAPDYVPPGWIEGAQAEPSGGPVTVPLGSSAAQSAATLALTAPTQIPLGSSPATSSATLALTAPTQIPLGTAAAGAGATLALTAATTIPLGTCAAVCSATISIIAPRQVPLDACAAQSGVGAYFHLDAYGPYADEVKADSALFYWRLDETSGTTAREHGAYGDTGTRTFDGTYVNTPTLGATGPLAAEADKTGATFTASSSERVNATTLSGFFSAAGTSSWEFWFKSTSTSQQAILGAANSGDSSSVLVETNSKADGTALTGGTRFSMTNAAGTANRCHVTSLKYDGTWNHVVAVTDATAGWIIYVNGQSVTTTDQSGTPSNPSNLDQALDIGGINFAGTHTLFLDGTLDEVAIYSTRLSASRVLAHYNAAFHKVPLGTCAAQSSATLALTAPTQVPLGSSAAQSAATLALTATTRVPLGQSDAVSSATCAIGVAVTIPLATAGAQSAATLILAPALVLTSGGQSSASNIDPWPFVFLNAAQVTASAALALTAPTRVVLGTCAAVSTTTLAIDNPVHLEPLSCAAQSSASAVIGIYQPPPDTHPDLGGDPDEGVKGGAVDEALTGGVVTAHTRTADIRNLLRGGDPVAHSRGGLVVESLRGAQLPGNRGGTFDEGLTGGLFDEAGSGAELEGLTGGLFDETPAGGLPDESNSGGDPDDSDRGGTYDLVLTGGEVY